MIYLKNELNSITHIFIKMAIIATSIEAILSFFYGDFEIYDLLLSFLIYSVGLSFIFGCALILPS